MNKPTVLAEGKYLRLVRRDGWDFVQRKNASGVVLITALTPSGRVLFVEQYRPPVNARVIEFPAGLAGDMQGAENEPLEEAARRELLEETGYAAGDVRAVMVGTSSAGLTDELVTFCVARDLRKVGAGGGDESESIVVHETALEGVDGWLQEKMRAGCRVGARVYAGLYLLQRHLQQDG